MEIKGKAHCFFEQSGTFRDAFRRRGIEGIDYDLYDDYGQTDRRGDLFAEIEAEWMRGRSEVFAGICRDDLIVAFFPCIEFSCVAQMQYNLRSKNYCRMGQCEAVRRVIGHNRRRAEMYERLLMLVGVCLRGGLRLVVENPWAINSYLRTTTFLKRPDVVDWDRTRRGDNMVKPTAYWFFNCAPTWGETRVRPEGRIRHPQSLPPSRHAGTCGGERCEIAPVYADAWINDFILGREREDIDRQGRLFPDYEEAQNNG